MRLHPTIGLMAALGISVSIGTAQTYRIDSLKQLLYRTSQPAARLQVLFSLCEERSSLNSDTLAAYANLACQTATTRHDTWGTMQANYYQGYVLLKQSRFDSVINEANQQLTRLDQTSGPQWLKNLFLYLKGQTLVRSSQYKEALQTYYLLLHQSEAANDTFMQVRAKTGIGWSHMEMNQHKEALRWFAMALATTHNTAFLECYGFPYSNMASVYNNLNRTDSAAYYSQVAVQGARRQEQLTNLANSLYIQAIVFINQHNNTAAEAALNEALVVRRRIGDPFYIVSDMAQLASFYASIGQYEKGIRMAHQAVDTTLHYRLAAKLTLAYSALAENLKAKGDYKGYSTVQETLLQLKDSMYQQNSAQALADLQAKYNVQRSENIIIQKNLDLVRKNYMLYGTLLLSALLSILFITIIINYRKRQRLQMEKVLEEQQQRETIAILQAEEKERKRIAADLHDNLGAYVAAISADARHLQQTAAPSAFTRRMEEHAESMVNQLNDTIWVLKKQSQHLTEVGDRLKVWMQKLMHSYPAVQYDFEESITEVLLLSPTQALHLFYMLQECINNALRHSGCSHIVVTLSDRQHQLKATVWDNGQGFDAATATMGNGIRNLQRRAALCQWQIHWKKKGGTIVTIEE
jgi:two-component system, NarL family, sensor kinase